MKRTLLLLGICAAVGFAPPAHAQGRGKRSKDERAQQLFDTAFKLMEGGEYAPACPLLEQSEQLDPAMGTRFRLAECYEKTGRLGSAWTLFNDVAEAAKFAQNADREQVARQRAAALEKKIPKITVNVPPEVSTLYGLEVRVRGKALRSDGWGIPQPADLGDNEIEVKARGKKTWTQAVNIEKPAQAVVVDVPALEDAPPEDAPPPPKKAPAPQGAGRFLGITWTPQRIGAVAAGGVGLLGILIGTGFGASAASQWGDAQDTCEGGDTSRCTPEGVALAEDASSAATVSTVFFAVGIVGLGAGAFLWFTAPPDEAPGPRSGLRVTPVVGPGGVGGVVQGTF
jgi:hypothetical protein